MHLAEEENFPWIIKTRSVSDESDCVIAKEIKSSQINYENDEH